jgi:hypothetical protein
VRIATDPMTLEVLPIPTEYPADHPWLPAEDLTLADLWSPADARVKVGDPLTRTLRARVEGNVGSAIPPVEPALPEEHFRRYPEPPELHDDQGSTTLRGIREQTYAIIPTAPGAVSLPPTEVLWWDVTARQVRTARAPGRSLSISGAPARPSAAATESAAEAAGPSPAETPLPVDVDVREDQVPWPGPARRRAMWLTLLGIVATSALLLWWSGRRAPPAAARQPASRRACWRALRHACRGDDTTAMHHALLDYLQSHYRAPLAESVRRFRAAGHGAVLDALNAGLYRDGAAASVSGREVLDEVREIRRRRRAVDDALPALYD